LTGERVRVVFMGSPWMAVPTLEAAAARADVALVVTQPDRPGGRGRRLQPTAVRAKAEALDLPVLAVEDVNAAAAIDAVRDARPDAIIVVSFGQMLKRRILSLPRLGCLNVHFSLLPELRGAAPVAWAIIRGYEGTGVSVIRMVRRMDAGPVYAQRAEAIREDDTTATLSERLSRAGAELMMDALPRVLSGEASPVEQDDALATFAPKVTREMGAVDWRRPAREVDRLIRGLCGQLEAYGWLRTRAMLRVTLYLSAFVEGASPGPGAIVRGPKGELLAGCGGDLVEIKEIQAEGRKRVSGRDFANGYHLTSEDRFADAEQGNRKAQ
jgi:methionyl-tRNA formyltransferase